jgi:hypothetical protein
MLIWIFSIDSSNWSISTHLNHDISWCKSFFLNEVYQTLLPLLISLANVICDIWANLVLYMANETWLYN